MNENPARHGLDAHLQHLLLPQGRRGSIALPRKGVDHGRKADHLCFQVFDACFQAAFKPFPFNLKPL